MTPPVLEDVGLMLIVLPLFVLLLLVLLRRPYEPGWRSAVLSAAVIWGLIVTVITEVLSAVHLLTATWVAGTWALTSFTLAIHTRASLVQILDLRFIKTTQVSLRLGLLLTSVGVIVAATGLIALVAPPNTWDSMTYHMARVMQWIQHQTVAHYPTHTPNQLHRNPWAEFAILHLQLLSHGDRFANLVQWLSMLGSLVGVSLIAKQLGADRRGQLVAAVMTATIPMGILQASSTQTDYAGAFWLVCFVSLALPLLAGQWPPSPWSSTVLTGVSLSLAVLTKATAYLYALPFLLWMGVAGLRRYGKKYIVALMVMASITVAINLGHYWRNLDLYGSPIGPAGEDLCPTCKVTNDTWTLPLFLSILVRNVGIHLGTPFEPLNERLEGAISAFHSLIGVEVNDPRSTWLQEQFVISTPGFDENRDGNTFHVLLITLAFLCLITLNRVRSSPSVIPYSLALIAGFLLLSLALKWNLNNSRLHLSLFVLWSPLIGIVLSRLKWPWFSGAVLFFAIVSSLPWVLFNSYRPLFVSPFECRLPPYYKVRCPTASQEHRLEAPTIFSADRNRLYFIKDPKVAASYAAAAHFLLDHHCLQIGLVKRWDDWEYPLWVLMQGPESQPVRIEHVAVVNSSAVLSVREPYRGFRPCAILSIVGGQLSVTLDISTPASDG